MAAGTSSVAESPASGQDQRVGFAEDDNQFLTFTLGDEQYGVEILRVQEIKGYTTITPVPNVPHYVKGVINLRGTIIPVVDLRTRLDMPAAEYNKFTVIIVVKVGQKIIGVIVDAVSDVLTISSELIQAPPEIGARVDSRFVRGIAKTQDRLVILLNIELLLKQRGEAVDLEAAGGA